MTSSVIFSLGLAPIFTLTNDLIIGAAPPERAGAASAISETGAELGGALSIAVLGTIGTAIYRNQVTEDLPAGVPPEQADAAQETLGGAVAVAEDLPARLADEVLVVAQEAFTLGFQVSALLSAVARGGDRRPRGVPPPRLRSRAGGRGRDRRDALLHSGSRSSRARVTGVSWRVAIRAMTRKLID